MKAEEDAAQHEHEAAAQAEREAEGDLAEIESGRHLATFIADRASASEYRARLGLIAAVREDFERLTGMLAEREAAATNETAAAGATEGETPEAPLPRIQRVVLYIDDLDRCPAERVVEVLEAVHLLLAFELFVVVVGVDSRWLLNSLRRHYAAQLAVQADGDEAVAEAAHWASTPQNYLEKIFQIPYVLRRMDDKGFRRLVADLLASPASSAPSGAGEGTGDTAPPAHEPPPRPQYAMVTQRPGGPHDDSAPHAPTIASEVPRKPPEPPPVDLRPAALQFKQAEVDYLAGLCRLVTTPRAAKRLANTYRLVRAGLNGPELDRFTGADGSEGKYREVLLMLAALARSSSVGATLLGRIEALPGDAGWGDFLESLANADDSLHAAAEREDWQGFRTALAAIASADPRPLSIEHMKAWRLKVARFSFLAGMAHR